METQFLIILAIIVLGYIISTGSKSLCQLIIVIAVALVLYELLGVLFPGRD